MEENVLVFCLGASLPWGAMGIAAAWALNHALPRTLRPVCRSLVPAAAAAYAAWDVTGGTPLWAPLTVGAVWAVLMQVGRVTGKGLKAYDDVNDFRQKFFRKRKKQI